MAQNDKLPLNVHRKFGFCLFTREKKGWKVHKMEMDIWRIEPTRMHASDELLLNVGCTFTLCKINILCIAARICRITQNLPKLMYFLYMYQIA